MNQMSTVDAMLSRPGLVTLSWSGPGQTLVFVMQSSAIRVYQLHLSHCQGDMSDRAFWGACVHVCECVRDCVCMCVLRLLHVCMCVCVCECVLLVHSLCCDAYVRSLAVLRCVCVLTRCAALRTYAHSPRFAIRSTPDTQRREAKDSPKRTSHQNQPHACAACSTAELPPHAVRAPKRPPHPSRIHS